MKLKLPDVDTVRELLDYNPATGALTWKHNNLPAGFRTERGYIRVRLQGTLYYAQRLAWLHYHGVPPKGDIDHKDGVGDNNAVINLRDVSQLTNIQNQRKPRKQNKAGLLGVSKTRYGNFQSEIMTKGERTFLGTFPTAQEAHQAYIKAKRALHEGCTL